jgi:hypothetical protein
MLDKAVAPSAEAPATATTLALNHNTHLNLLNVFMSDLRSFSRSQPLSLQQQQQQ